MMEFNQKRRVFDKRNDEPISIEHSLKIDWEKLDIGKTEKENVSKKL